MRAMLARVPGVANPVVRPIPQQPTVAVKVNLAAAQKYGLRPGDIRRDATTLTSGLIVGNLYEQSKIFDVVVWGAPADAQQPDRAREHADRHAVRRPGGPQGRRQPHRPRRSRPPSSTTTCCAAWRWPPRSPATRSAVAAAVRAQIARMPMPYEYHAEVFGSATIRSADATRGLAYGAVALVGIFLLLQAAVAQLAARRADAGLAAAVRRRRQCSPRRWRAGSPTSRR